MVGQYLSNTDERATVSILQNILELNKALLEVNKAHVRCAHAQLRVRDPSVRFAPTRTWRAETLRRARPPAVVLRLPAALRQAPRAALFSSSS